MFGCSAICFPDPRVTLQQGRVDWQQSRQGCVCAVLLQGERMVWAEHDASGDSHVNCKANLLLNGVLLQAKVGLDDFLEAWRRALKLLEYCPVQGLLPAGTVWHKLSDVRHGEVCNCVSAAAVRSQHSSQGSNAGVAR